MGLCVMLLCFVWLYFGDVWLVLVLVMVVFLSWGGFVS